MGKLNVQVCPETGICSIVKPDGSKVDLMPDEVDSLRVASGKAESIQKIIADVDETFAAQLDPAELKQLSDELR